MTTYRADISPDPGPQELNRVWDKFGEEWNRVTHSSYWRHNDNENMKVWDTLVFHYGPLTDESPIPDDADYAYSESGNFFKRVGDEWIILDPPSRSEWKTELPTDEKLIFLKEIKDQPQSS